MISIDSPKQSPEAELAALVHGLRYRGLAVGVDDAARIERLFRHAGDWSHQRRVRALKMLLARSDSERQLLDQLAPFLFVKAEKRADGEAAAKARRLPEAHTTATEDRKGPQNGESSVRVDVYPPREIPKGSRKWKRRWWRTGAILLGSALLAFLWAKSRWNQADPAQIVPQVTSESSGLEAVQPGENSKGNEGGSLLSRWAFALLAAATLVLAWHLASRALRRELNIRQLAASRGPRSYRLQLPVARRGNPQDAGVVREVTFHLNAPTADAPAPWPDLHGTVEATVRNAGRFTLRWATRREHRPVLFIEDVSPSMAPWPGFGQQIAAGILRQGGDVEQFFMSGMPDILAPDAEMRRRIPLEQVLAGLTEPAVVVVSDATGLDSPRARTRVKWLGLLTSATWLHPGTVETWGPGARWLAERLRVVPMTDEGLLRLGTPRQGGEAMALPCWHPPRVLWPAADARVASLRAALGKSVFLWLAAGAVLEKVGVLTTELWWALRSEGIASAPRDEIDRVWRIDDVRVGGDGRVRFPADLTEALLDDLRKKNPDLLSKVVAWVEAIVAADLKTLDHRSPAAVEARVIHSELPRNDPRRLRTAWRRRKQLRKDGYGKWCPAEETTGRVVVRLFREKLGRNLPLLLSRLITGSYPVDGCLSDKRELARNLEDKKEKVRSRHQRFTSAGAVCRELNQVTSPNPAADRVIAGGEPPILPDEVRPVVVAPPSPDSPEQDFLPMEETDYNGIVFVRIRPGTFTMGSAAAYGDERPAHQVTLSEFWIGKYLITNEQYRRFRPDRKEFKSKEGELPATWVSWEDARDFCEQLGYRLPTEAEWEYAARAGTKTPWSFGDYESEIGRYAWYAGNSGARIHPVGAREPNPWGLYDMHGNVWEWVDDEYERYLPEPQINPFNPVRSRSSAVIRGGAYWLAPRHLRSAYRDWQRPVIRLRYIGFRCVRDPLRQP